MERVTGIGGFFFKARDPAAISRWYAEHLGVTVPPSSYDEEPWTQEAGPTAFTPFESTTTYFGRPNGVFARLHDPEGNPIQLWEPRAPKG